MVKSSAYVPEQGEVVWLSFHPRTGHEQGGRRTAVVLSPGAYNQRVGLAIVCPVTGQVKGYPFEVVIPPNLPIGGAVLADQVKSLDWRARKAEPICLLPAPTVAEILQKLTLLLTPQS